MPSSITKPMIKVEEQRPGKHMRNVEEMTQVVEQEATPESTPIHSATTVIFQMMPKHEPRRRTTRLRHRSRKHDLGESAATAEAV